MAEWLIVYLSSFQAGVLRGLATELRAGGVSTAALAFTLGAVHALTPGHGKALAAYFLGREARIGKGLRVALAAALLHVLSGLALFFILRLTVGRTLSITGRPSPAFLVVGYGLIVVSGMVMLVQSLRPPTPSADHGLYALTGGVELLPCPLTISVLGFAWAQGTMAMVGLVLLSLALGIAATIGIVAVLAIAGRSLLGASLVDRLPHIARAGRILQGVAGAAIIAIGVLTILTLRSQGLV
jgi:ABC-type nickel/cobalt efflux system permease component RcnA